ncbi:MAG TPA: hypothetical protein VEO19_09640, partial [Terriglobia bacterium]|nr:hypothetical protein [Terriglobia bacterium]
MNDGTKPTAIDSAHQGGKKFGSGSISAKWPFGHSSARGYSALSKHQFNTNKNPEEIVESLQLVREEIPMTLQVAMVGTDGIIVASDRQVMLYDGPRATRLSSKIIKSRSKGVVLAWSGHDIAYEISRRILNEEEKFDFEFEEDKQPIEEIARAAYSEEYEGKHDPQSQFGEIIIVSASNLSNFYTLKMSSERQCRLTAILDKAIAGDIKNPVHFFVETYYKKTEICNLLTLASYTIWTSVITSKAAIHDQSKTGQRSSSETELFYPICTLSGNSISLEGSPRR